MRPLPSLDEGSVESTNSSVFSNSTPADHRIELLIQKEKGDVDTFTTFALEMHRLSPPGVGSVGTTRKVAVHLA